MMPAAREPEARMRTLSFLALAFGFSLPGFAADPVPEWAEFQRKAAAYRPTASDLRWREIPWVTDPAEALAQAKAERRPLLVWLAGGRKQDGTPLERC
jgi:hypothetical protein